MWTGDNLDFPFIAEALTLTGIRQVKSCCRQTDQECYQGDKTEDYCTLNVFFHHNPSSWKNALVFVVCYLLSKSFEDMSRRLYYCMRNEELTSHFLLFMQHFLLFCQTESKRAEEQEHKRLKA